MIDHAPVLDLSKYIEKHFFGIRPHLRGHRLPVATVAYMARDSKYSIADLTDAFTISESEVLAALLYYAENKQEIDKQEAAYQAVAIEDWINYGDDALALLLRRNDAASSSQGIDKTGN